MSRIFQLAGRSMRDISTFMTTWRANGELFADDAIARLHRVSNGLPRALNNAATAAIIAAAAGSKDLIDDACAKKAVAELTRGLTTPRQAAR
jgi:hypothetical protein